MEINGKFEAVLEKLSRLRRSRHHRFAVHLLLGLIAGQDESTAAKHAAQNVFDYSSDSGISRKASELLNFAPIAAVVAAYRAP